tara:strand:- start:31 stop:192 length:162 start_codon:yes stop_codon:yes gene_type:complete
MIMAARSKRQQKAARNELWNRMWHGKEQEKDKRPFANATTEQIMEFTKLEKKL